MPGPTSTPNTAPLLRIDVEGRKHYLAGGRVSLLPVDLPEASRLDKLHDMIPRAVLQCRLHVSDLNVRPGFRVLDIAYGTALWLSAMRAAYPKYMTLVGVDHTIFETSLTQTEYEMREIDLRSPVDYNDDTWSSLQPEQFDFVHMSNLSAAVRDWSGLLQTAHRYLKPGTGKIELVLMNWQPQSYDKTQFPEAGKAMLYWYHDLMTATADLGVPIAYPQDIGELLQLAGFIDVGRMTVRIPMCDCRLDTYEQKIANEFRTAMGTDPQAYQGMSMVPFTQSHKAWPAEVNKICERVTKIPASGKVQLYHDLYIWTARKP
ncbi:hypothetical protein LTR56_004593 [Elasticomyces elasticus]|nr:hypothetical protein LTR56_004593 [Elasticomyces elasticus]KAK3659887.1 hypothetical protein LTR22_008254 [Elasticomyces elasticus]KAK4925932.1 hypothetical protein LTR49_007070 [Elasticomyces elasticus]KAK5768169.1 hypothetical protein LTS12_001653 [Elasticomyces elasticus]